MIPLRASCLPAIFGTSPNPAATSSTEKCLASGCRGNAFDQLASGGDSAEPAVDAGHVAQGGFDLVLAGSV